VIDDLEVLEVRHSVTSDRELEIKDRRVSIWVFEPATSYKGFLECPVASNNYENFLV
jgi:hypothetical protein